MKHDKALLKITNDLASAEQFVDENSRDMAARMVYASRITMAYSMSFNSLLERAVEKGYKNEKLIEEVYNAERNLHAALGKITDDIIVRFEKQED